MVIAPPTMTMTCLHELIHLLVPKDRVCQPQRSGGWQIRPQGFPGLYLRLLSIQDFRLIGYKLSLIPVSPVRIA